ncbi:GNAT family N-acetyltransferase [Paracoccus albus]|uniref:GNAT family N-acetyltransferase n=1 Tax=Paracoccus albus TaxID=3017784 RepID=UPI0022F04C7A|nr:GNAT family N-acetyltransferase [Paracoccus albus]WBU59180.1 GNAT family N-acetyltransferase [Paracoccus albus]
MSPTQMQIAETDRLILRRSQPQDLKAFIAYYATERSAGNGGPLDELTAWRGFAIELGHWQLHGFGMCTAIDKTSGAQIGRCGIWFPKGWPEPELGWTLYDGAEGKGYATEAATAMRRHAAAQWGLPHLISIIALGNIRSEAVATRLGATVESDWTSPAGRKGRIWRHPKEAA